MAEAETFTCDQCGGTFPKAWTDEEAMAEATANFGGQLGEAPAVVCDDCYHAMTTLHPIGDYLDGKTLAESMAELRDSLAKAEAERVAKMGPLERLIHERLTAEFNRRMDEEMDRLLYGGLQPCNQPPHPL